MIASRRNGWNVPKSEFVQRQFLKMLPQIRRQAERTLRFLRTEAREELVAEVIAHAYRAWVRLVDQGREQIARPSPLARFALRQVRAGRRMGGQLNVQDLLSDYARQIQGFTVERIDRPEASSGSWQQILVEDRRADPAETAAARLDVAAWLQTLSTRNRKIAKRLAWGDTTDAVARQFGLSAARVSQLRRWFQAQWERFQSDGEPAPSPS
jgi:hypothetical protein